MDGHSLEVIGTLTKFKSFLGDDQNDKAILIPYNSFKKTYPGGQGPLHLRAGGARQDGAGQGRSDRAAAPAPAREASEPDNFGISSAESLIGAVPPGDQHGGAW